METIISILAPSTWIVLLVLERLFPARPLPEVRWWWLKGFLFFVAISAIGGALPALFAALLGKWSLLHLGWLGTIAGGVLGFALADFASYWVHRLLHNVPFLWRWTHQMHHSAERLDVLGAAYFHPFDVAVQFGVNTFAVTALGLAPDAALLCGYIGMFAGVFQHVNMKTPVWFGYIMQRPEAHSVHHARGVHAYNYGNFMLWDVLFGTFRNPATFAAEPSGFWDGASARVGAMLVGRDVGEPPVAARVTSMDAAAAAAE